MDFLGLLAADFDFFRKKDKLSREDYEKQRNDIKLHFRSLCYEIQKIYHKKMGGVLEVNKEFNNFTRKSVDIFAEFKDMDNMGRRLIVMNSEGIIVRLALESCSEEEAVHLTDLLKIKKEELWNYILHNKSSQINCSFKYKKMKNNFQKLNAVEINNKNYDNFLQFIENNIREGKYEFDVSIQYAVSKSDCIKQSKNLANQVYDLVINTLELSKNISGNK